MSGGSMNYLHEQLRTILADHETLFSTVDSNGNLSASRTRFKSALTELHAMHQAFGAMLRAIEKEDSGDCRPDQTNAAYEKLCGIALERGWMW